MRLDSRVSDLVLSGTLGTLPDIQHKFHVFICELGRTHYTDFNKNSMVIQVI